MSFDFGGIQYRSVVECAEAIVNSYLSADGRNDLATQKAVLSEMSNFEILQEIHENVLFPDGVDFYDVQNALCLIRYRLHECAAVTAHVTVDEELFPIDDQDSLVHIKHTWTDEAEMVAWLAWYRRMGGEVLHVEIY
jgi:hypothetical protein